MKNTLTWKKIVILGVLLMTPFTLAKCGAGDSVASATASAGPTYPSKYYFEATVTPNVVDNKGTVGLVVRVWDENGYPVSGAVVIVVGPNKSATTGTKGTTGTSGTGGSSGTSGSGTGSTGTTGDNGIKTFPLNITGDAGGIIYLAVLVENSVVQVPVQIRPSATATTS
ncbi:hypothetical protein MNBD_NITROSPINAE04-1163 [hydrothermal vent metagenome]|uniref:Uncharacterized protein n=1 Tax=hydrothermal vent metagenome TaxID=652676 RepID=A0A3B1B8X9_9ZZZZ